MAEVAAPARWRPWASRVICAGVFHTLYPLTTHGREYVPEGPVLLVANHSAFLDGPIVAATSPRPVTFLVKQEAYAGLFGRLLRFGGHVPIDRSVGDRAALSAARKVLERGDVLGMFPEGTRGTGEVASVHRGAAWLALRTGATVVPVACHGTLVAGGGSDAWPRGGTPMSVTFGQGFTVHPVAGTSPKDQVRSASEQLREVLAAHVRSSRGTSAMPDNGGDPVATPGGRSEDL